MAHIAAIEIAPYDPAWPARFEAEKRVLLEVFHSVRAQGANRQPEPVSGQILRQTQRLPPWRDGRVEIRHR